MPARGRWLLHAAAASAVYGLAVLHHQNAASFADLPTDAVLALDRAVSIARFEALPLRGNPVGIAWFGVAEDYLLAPFLVGVSSLEGLLARASLFHALLAPLGYALGVAFRRPALGFAWGGFWATLPALVALSRDYPVNYRTTHWVLAALVCAVFLARDTRSPGQRVLWTWLLLLSAALAMASHPLALGALPAALLVAGVWGRPWRSSSQDVAGRAGEQRVGKPRGLGWAVIGAVVATLLVSGTYLISNVGPYIELLTSRSEDPQLSMGEAFRGSVAALKMLPDSAIVPAGAGPALLLVLGVVPAVILPVGRAAATWVAAWTALSFVAFSVAGYAASPWHLTPVVQPVLALGFVGWASALAPTAYPSRVRMLAHWVLAAGLVALWLPGVAPSPPRTATSPVASFSGLADRLVERAEQGQGLAYFEAQSRCGMDWSPEATVLDLRLRSGAAAFRQTSPDAPLLALVEDVPSLQPLGLDGLQDRFVLPNGVAMKLYAAEQAGPWIDRFRRGCTIGDRSPTLLDVPMVVGGNAAPKGFETCVLPAPCPSYRTFLP